MVSVISRVRWALSQPVVALSVVVLSIGYALHLLTRATREINRLNKHHVWFPLIMVARWIRGFPTWTPHDLLGMGIQPFTKRHVEIAKRSEDLVALCACGHPKCKSRGLFAGASLLTRLMRSAAQANTSSDTEN